MCVLWSERNTTVTACNQQLGDSLARHRGEGACTVVAVHAPHHHEIMVLPPTSRPTTPARDNQVGLTPGTLGALTVISRTWELRCMLCIVYKHTRVQQARYDALNICKFVAYVLLLMIERCC